MMQRIGHFPIPARSPKILAWGAQGRHATHTPASVDNRVSLRVENTHVYWLSLRESWTEPVNRARTAADVAHRGRNHMHVSVAVGAKK